MRVTIAGCNPPGRTFCRPDGSAMEDVHVGVQVRRGPADLVPGDRSHTWEVEVDVVGSGVTADFRGPAVQGKKGERFLYLTWGNLDANGEFEMFRRAKLMLHHIEPDVLTAAVEAGRLAARVDLSDERGEPRCARVDPPAVVWSVPS